jgi:glutaconate CoA-transferase subunit A
LATAQEAVSSLINDGDCLAVGGFVTNRRPYALVREIIRQGKQSLYIEGGPSGGDIDMLIGAGCVAALSISYIANSGFSMVCRRFRDAAENGKLLFEDFSLDVQTIAYHGAALGLSYVPVKNMLGSDMLAKWGISEEERKKHPKLPVKKYILQEDPFHQGGMLCLVPTPRIDVAVIHVQKASPSGICRIEGPIFQDTDIAVAAVRTIVSCDELVSDEEICRRPELNTLTGLCVDAVVHLPFGAHPSQCFGLYDYDSRFYIQYEQVSRTQRDFDAFLRENVHDCPTHDDYLNNRGAAELLKLRVAEGYGYVPGLKRK